MHNIESRRNEASGGAFEWVVPLAFLVTVLVLSWTGVYVVVNQMVEAAAQSTVMADSLHE